VSGNHYQIGYTIGNYFKREIQLSFKRRKDWFETLKQYVATDTDHFFQHLKTMAERFYPHLMEELRGLSDGSEIPFNDLFLLNVKSEIETRMAINSKPEPPGCSTIYTITEKQKRLFHNEDGHFAYQDTMFVVKATPPSGVTVITLTYPGYLMGNGPSLNSNGIIQTTNYISSGKVKKGIPRYFLGRAILEARTLEQAIRIATHPERAFPYHHNLASFKTGKMISLETTPNSYEIFEPKSLYVHTNHLILDQTKTFPQNSQYVNTSSITRYRTISQALDNISDQTRVNLKEIFQILSSHQNPPYSPCRHPSGNIKGITLSTAVFNILKGTMRIYKGFPCKSFQSKAFSDYSF
jgi:predicted choloylglycine hydrolase